MSHALITVPVSAADALSLLPLLVSALTADGPAVMPIDGADDSRDGGQGRPPEDVPDEVAVVVRTSGSTGEPRAVMLSAAALRASAEATAARLGGTGHAQWLLALPPDHVAGLQVLVRSVHAGTTPVVMDLSTGFRPAAFATAVRGMEGAPLCTSLVPTQLVRLLDDTAGLAALRDLDAVLLGGAATPAPLVARARDAGVPIVTTYGMTETCGGCVYDGEPLAGVRVRVDDDDRILIAGPVLATGYLARPDLDAEGFLEIDGVRWFRTSDLGLLHGSRRRPADEAASAPTGAGQVDRVHLEVAGRADDVIVSGGVKVAPAAVETVLAQVPGIAEVCVVGVPDDEWGQAVTAVLVLRAGVIAPRIDELRAAVTAALGAPAAPRRVVVVDALPLRGPGKVDRRASALLALAPDVTSA